MRRAAACVAVLQVAAACVPSAAPAASRASRSWPTAEREVREPAPADPVVDTVVVPEPPPNDDLAARFDGVPAVEVLEGRASYYHDSLAGNPTATGEPYDPAAMTCASRTLPFGTIVRVIHARTGARVYVRVNDRGPFGDARRILDLSRAAATALGVIDEGVAPVRAEIVELGPGPRGRAQVRPRRHRRHRRHR